jgi:predicted transcriptional regulator
MYKDKVRYFFRVEEEKDIITNRHPEGGMDHDSSSG